MPKKIKHFTNGRTMSFFEPKRKGKQIGSTGTDIMGGYISEDYNNDLQFPKSNHIYDKMRKGDGTVKAVLLVAKLPLLSAKYYVDVAEDMPKKKAEEMKEFIKYVFFEQIKWKYFLRHCLLMFDFGFSVFEKVYIYKEGKLVFQTLAPRLPKSIQQWLPTKYGETTGVRQYGYKIEKDGSSYGVDAIIPAEKTFLLTLDREGDNYEGTSLLRSAYKHWYFKEVMYKIQSIGAERMSIGLPVGRFDDGIVPTAEEEASAIEVLENVRANEQQYILEKGFSFRFEVPKEGGFNFENAILHHDRQIAKSILAQFLETGSQGSKGGYSQNTTDQRLFLRSIRSHSDYLLDEINSTLVKEMIDLNFGVQKAYPKIKMSAIEELDIPSLVQSIEKMFSSKAITTTFETENWLRELLNMPLIPEEEFLKEKEEKAIINEKIVQVPQKQEKIENKKKEIPIEKTNPTKEKAKIEKEVKSSKKKASNEFGIGIETAIRTSIEQKQFGEYYRELTTAEKKVDFKKMKTVFDVQEKKAKEIGLKYGEMFLKQIKKDVSSNLEGGGTPDLELSGKIRTDMSDELYQNFNETYEKAKAQTIVEMGKSQRVKTPTGTKVRMKSRADSITDDMYNDMETQANFIKNNAVRQGFSKSAITSSISMTLKEIYEKKSTLFGRLETAIDYNDGVNTVYSQFDKEVWGYQFSAILDGRTSPICLSLDGRVTKKWADMPKPPLHANCRSRIISILKDQAEKPKLDPPPKEITKNINPNIFKTIQPKKAIVSPNTPAEKEIKDRTKREERSR